MSEQLHVDEYKSLSNIRRYALYCEQCREIERQKARITDLEAIIRGCFIVWRVGGTVGRVVFGNAPNGTTEHKEAIIDICEPRPDAPAAAGEPS